MKRIFPVLVFFGVMAFPSFGQVKPCSTTEMFRLAVERDPQIKVEQERLEQFTRDYILRKDRSEDVYVIPVVFHIVHNYGEENISKDQVLDALRVMNEDFRKDNPDTTSIVSTFKPIAADCRIEFRLARRDPSGQCTDGITRTVSGLTYAADDQVKDLVRWDRSKYLNIWVVRSIASGAAGYSYYPGIGAQADGVVILHSYTGSIGTASSATSRTLTHEVGHYLNLMHTWGNSNEPELADNCNDDDQVSDTPNTIGHTSCDLTAVTCGSLDNVQNYMEYAPCRRMFTLGQKARMRAALNSNVSSRNSLWQVANLVATGTNDGYAGQDCPLVPDFKISKVAGCQGLEVQMTDLSYNGSPVTWLWECPGGFPAASTEQNPVITYVVPGSFTVRLTVTNAVGSFVKEVQKGVRVADTLAGGSIPFTESFEATDVLTANGQWFAENPGTTGWKRTVTADHSGLASVKIDNKSIEPGTISNLVSYVIVPEGEYSTLTLSWAMAYAQVNADSDDELRVYLSTDCGNSWILRYIKSGAFLSTVSGYRSGTFIPSASEWDVLEREIAGSVVHPGYLLVKFQMVSGSGNTLFVDDVNLQGELIPSNGLDEVFLRGDILVTPNPCGLDGRMGFYLPRAGMATLEILDILGQRLGSVQRFFPAGQSWVRVDELVDRIPPGTYLVKISGSPGLLSGKLIIR